MNMTNADFKAIEKALMLLPNGEEFRKLDKETQDIITDAEVAMVKLCRKRRLAREKTAAYIAEKRKTNKNYARSRKED